MSEQKQILINSLRHSIGRTGPEMNQDLKLLGDGVMADGLCALWQAGQRSGAVKGATCATVIIGLSIATYVLIRNKLKDAQVAKQIAAYEKEHGSVPTIRITISEESDQSAIAATSEPEGTDIEQTVLVTQVLLANF